ncbi:hypothetical protein SADUNF_Sadunf15G0063700 [Salix dunnii]|uniref:Small ribosomal subunit protein uS3 C-terminal domain-containing protein n=1 Tax=Salix dunnii TaxID=1413687 RepID=A0A835JEA9_9ROSI|nr:hypothetical protein SADUNF_Sadunf15G0063700 [Salix dunnii]
MRALRPLWELCLGSNFCYFYRACYGVLRFAMESGATGCEVIVSGKLRAQCAKSMKFKDGYMISSGQPVKEYIDSAVRHVLLRQVSFLSCVSLVDCHALQSQQPLYLSIVCNLNGCAWYQGQDHAWDPKGKVGSMIPLPDLVTNHPPKEEEEYAPPLLTTNIEIPVA